MAGSKGHEQSAKYVEAVMRAAGYKVTKNEFDFVYVEAVAEKLTVNGANAHEVPIHLMTYTASTPEGGVTAQVAAAPVDADGTNGCEPGDFAAGAFTGKIALVKRGGCTFAVKQTNAAAAGAVGAVIYNNTDGALNGTLGDPNVAKIPTGGVTKAEGEKLAAEVAAARSRSPSTSGSCARTARRTTSSRRPAAETRTTPSSSARTSTRSRRARASTTTAPARPASSRSPSASRAARTRSTTRSSSPGGRLRSSACSARRRMSPG